MGYVTTRTDGVFGPRPREMIAAWQKKVGRAVTGYLTADAQAALLRDAEPSPATIKSDYTAGFGQPGEKFSYPVEARFEAKRGTGLRTQTRTCRFTFVKL
jgi:peptidoglycan hydrolase-like protein with peptidoglycan-binding domain